MIPPQERLGGAPDTLGDTTPTPDTLGDSQLGASERGSGALRTATVALWSATQLSVHVSSPLSVSQTTTKPQKLCTAR